MENIAHFRPVDFLIAVTRPTGAAIELRAMGHSAVVGRTFCRTRRDISYFVGDYSKCNLYFGVAARRSYATGGALEHCFHFASLFIDIDFKLTAHEIADATLSAFALAPSAIVYSGGGLHVYWFLIKPLMLPADAARAKTLLRKLAIALHADVIAAEPVRILRIPTTFNYKYDPPRKVSIEVFTGATYSLADFDALLTNVVDPEGTAYVHGPRHHRSTARYSSGRAVDFTRIAAGIPDGQRDNELFRLALSLGRRGYSCEMVIKVVRDAASRCIPPFPPREADQKVMSAWRYL
jgi:hypothetical protein